MKNVIRTLSTGTIISSKAFGQLDAVKQTETLATAQAANKPFVFVDSFSKLADTRKLAERLLAGEDVAMELEFNSVELSDEERKGLDLVRPLLERLKNLKPSGYPWLSDEEIKKAGDAEFYHLSRYDSKVYDTTASHSIQKAQIKRIWDAHVKFMLTGEKPITRHCVRMSYSNRHVNHLDNGAVKIGCTTISLAGVQAVARHFGFEVE